MIWNYGKSEFPTDPGTFKVIFYSWFYFIEDIRYLLPLIILKTRKINKVLFIIGPCIQNPVKHLRPSVLRKQLTAKSCELFSKNAPSQMFGRVLYTPLLMIIKKEGNISVNIVLKYYFQDIFRKRTTLFYLKQDITNSTNSYFILGTFWTCFFSPFSSFNHEKIKFQGLK